MSRKLIASIALVLLCLVPFAVAGQVAFKPEQSYPVGTNPKAVAVADFNHDGKRDLAVLNYGDPTTNNNGSVSILFGNGDGTFQAAANVAIGRNCTTFVVGDFNGDGNDDLALLRPGDATVNDNGDVTIFLGNGDGTFRQGQVLAPGKNPSSSNTAMIAVDLNGDQRLDLVVANDGDLTFSVLLSNGNGTFQSPIAYPVTRGSPVSVTAVNLAGNGEKDLAVSRLVGLDLWFANGDGTFRQGPSVSSATAVITGDFNGDRKDDLVIHPIVVCIFHPCAPVSQQMLLGNGDGTFQSGISIAVPVSVAADFDGDGKLDLAGTDANNNILVLLGNGDGTFQSFITVNSNAPISQVLDVNGDTAPDFVIMGNNSISLMVNVGTDFSISASPLSANTLSPGQSATSTLTLQLLSNFNNPVSLACSVQPAKTGAPTCSLTSNLVTFDTNGNASATLTINAGSSAAVLGDPRSFHTFRALALWFPVLGIAFLGIGSRLRFSSGRKVLVAVIGGLLLTGVITACGAGGGAGGSGARRSAAYTITVTGTSGVTQHSTMVNLTVQ